MNPAFSASGQLHPSQLQSVHQLYQRGLAEEAEARARALLGLYPNHPALHNLLGLCQQTQGNYREALASFRKMLKIDPKSAEVHCNIGVIFTQMGNAAAAVGSYRKALELKPNLVFAHFNLAALLQTQQKWPEAERHYRRVIALEPRHFQALGNLGTILQRRGLLEQAERCYRQALAAKADAQGHFNLGTVLYGLGRFPEALASFREAVRLNDNFAEAWNSLGEILRDQGQMDEAAHCYQKAITANPGYGRARYNLGETCCLSGNFGDAIGYFEKTDFADSRERVLYCLYKTRQFEKFKSRFDELAAGRPHHSVLMASLGLHYALNFRQPNGYRFCGDPMAYVRRARIGELAEPGSPLLKQLLHDIRTLAIAERKQGRLYYGVQSAGNLLMRPEPSLRHLAGLIRGHVSDYRRHFAGSRDELIRSFPKTVEFASSWYLRMTRGGYLTSHIHEEGWISGCVYLQLPEAADGHEGSFVYETDGDDYPKLHPDFPGQTVDLQIGDIILFPSSLFHRTLPFHSESHRVCVAFDIKPPAG